MWWHALSEITGRSGRVESIPDGPRRIPAFTITVRINILEYSLHETFFPANKLIVVLQIEKLFFSRMRSTAVARISNTVRVRSATAVGEAKIQTPSDRLNTQERADYALVSP